jgi:hypothetical protein
MTCVISIYLPSIINIEDDEKKCNTIQDYLIQNEIFRGLKKGDIVENIYESGYRTEGVYIIDTRSGDLDKSKNYKYVNTLSYDYDDYGSISSNFLCFSEFEADHFIRANFKNASWHTNTIGISCNDIIHKNKKDFYYNESDILLYKYNNNKYLFDIEEDDIRGQVLFKNEFYDNIINNKEVVELFEVNTFREYQTNNFYDDLDHDNSIILRTPLSYNKKNTSFYFTL